MSVFINGSRGLRKASVIDMLTLESAGDLNLSLKKGYLTSTCANSYIILSCIIIIQHTTYGQSQHEHVINDNGGPVGRPHLDSVVDPADQGVCVCTS